MRLSTATDEVTTAARWEESAAIDSWASSAEDWPRRTAKGAAAATAQHGHLTTVRGKGSHESPDWPVNTPERPSPTCADPRSSCESRRIPAAAAAAARASSRLRKLFLRPFGRPPRPLIVFRTSSRCHKCTAGKARRDAFPFFLSFSEKLLKTEWFCPPPQG